MHFHLPQLKWLLIVGVPLLAVLAAAQQPPRPQNPDSAVTRLARERLQVADRGYRLAVEKYRLGAAHFSLVAEWARRQAQAHFDLGEAKAVRVEFLQGYVRQLRDAEQLARKSFDAGGSATQLDVAEAEYIRLEGEMWLAKAEEQ